MTITTAKQGVWKLDDAYKKVVAGYWDYDGLVLNELYAFGNNCNGNLGIGCTSAPVSSPIQVPGTQWACVSGSDGGTLAKKTDGTLWAWGSNNYGVHGTNSLINRSSPFQIPGTQWNNASMLRGFSASTKTDGTLWSWGQNCIGAVGDNTTTQRSSPVQIPGTQWCKVSTGVGSFATGAIKTDGTLWTWGRNSHDAGPHGAGQLGDSATNHRSSPNQIPGTQWNNVSSARYHGIATKTDGTLWAWGGNKMGQLGQNSQIHRSSPVQVPGNAWNNVRVGMFTTVASKTDGTLWSWGYNIQGQLGDSSRAYSSSPVQIPGTAWNEVCIGSSTLATKNDGTLWSWGRSYSGQLGLNNSCCALSSPNQIPGTNWCSPSNIGNYSFAIKCSTF